LLIDLKIKEMKSKRIREESDIVPWEYAFNNLLDTTDWDRKIKDFRAKHGISGIITWGELYQKDKNFADEFSEFLSNNQEETDRRYNENRTNLRMEKLKALDEKFKSEKPSKKKKTSSKKTKKNKDKDLEKEILVDLLKLPPETLTIRQIFKILRNTKLEYEKFEQYNQRLMVLNSKKNYNKPPHIKTAKALITKVFSGRANPLMWVPYDEIIKSKLYSIKMGIQYFKNNHYEEELKEVLKDYQPKIQELLLKMGYEDINDIKF
jgi:hypothetical protein